MKRFYFRLFIIVVLGLFYFSFALGQCTLEEQPLENFPITDGSINAMNQKGDTLFIGGLFRLLAPFSGSGVPLSASTAMPTPNFARVEGGDVKAVLPDGNGGWFIGGNFQMVNGVTQKALAHLLPDGGLDVNWTPDITLTPGAVYTPVTVSSLALNDSLLYIGGQFDTLDGAARNCVAALHRTSGALHAFDTQIAGVQLTAPILILEIGTLFIGGNFTQIGGESRYHLAAVNATTGQLLPFDAKIEDGDKVNALEFVNSKLYVAGTFTQLAGQTRRYLAAVNATSGALLPFNANIPTNSIINTLKKQVDKLYIGGLFTGCMNQSRKNAAAISTNTGLLLPWAPTVNGTEVLSILPLSNVVYLGGDFFDVNGHPAHYLAAVNPSNGALISWEPNPTGTVLALAYQNGVVYAGGAFGGINGTPRRNLAALSTINGQIFNWTPVTDFSVNAFARRDSTLYIGGSFETVNQQPRNSLAALHTQSGALLNWDPHIHDNVAGVYALCIPFPTIFNDYVYIGGSFEDVNGATHYNIARVHAVDAFPDEVWKPIIIGKVSAIYANESRLYIGGIFTSIYYGGNTQFNKGVAAFDLSGDGAPPLLPWKCQIGPDYQEVRAILEKDSSVYIGGDFRFVNNVLQKGVAKISRSTGALLNWPSPCTGEYPTVNFLAFKDSSVIAGGHLSDVSTGGFLYPVDLAKLDTATAAVSEWTPKFYNTKYMAYSSNGTINAGLLTETSLYVGGYCNLTGARTSLLAFKHGISGRFKADTNVVYVDALLNLTYIGNAAANANYIWDCDGCLQTPLSGPGPFALSWDTPGQKKITLIVEEDGCASKQDSTFIQVSIINATAAAKNKTKFRLYPNPTSGAFTLTYFASTNETQTLRITDLTGRVLENRNLAIKPGQNEFRLTLDDLSPGVYIVQFGNYTQKICVR